LAAAFVPIADHSQGVRPVAVHTQVDPVEVGDRLAIRELFDAYAHCADRRDADG
jgi:hypothetical protein